jgi:hypothetical protein
MLYVEGSVCMCYVVGMRLNTSMSREWYEIQYVLYICRNATISVEGIV